MVGSALIHGFLNCRYPGVVRAAQKARQRFFVAVLTAKFDSSVFSTAGKYS